MIVSRAINYVFLSMIFLLLSSCNNENYYESKEKETIYWTESDEFSQMDSHYLNATLTINSEGGQYLDLQFQCFRHKGAQVSIEQNLIVSSKIDPPSAGSRPYVDAVLFKNEGNSAQIYRDGHVGVFPVPFHDATLNLGQIFLLDSRGNYRSVQFRFVYGASNQDIQNGDVGALSRAASVDFNLSPADPEAEKFLLACAPVKNWKPPKA